jgi:hypothetical protein
VDFLAHLTLERRHRTATTLLQKRFP